MGAIWALWDHITEGASDMPLHLLALIFVAAAMAAGLVCGYVVYQVSAASGDAREVAFAWGAFGALLGPFFSLVTAVGIPPRAAPRPVCFLLGAVLSVLAALGLRGLATRIGRSEAKN